MSQTAIKQIFIPATLVYLETAAGEVLMLHRNKNPQDLHWGKYNGLGGKMEAHESAYECAQREVFEEAGLHIPLNKFELKGILFFPEFDQQLRHWQVFVFKALLTAKPTTLQENYEGSLVWVARDQITQLNLWPGDYHFIPKLWQAGLFKGKIVYENGILKSYEFYEEAVNLL